MKADEQIKLTVGDLIFQNAILRDEVETLKAKVVELEAKRKRAKPADKTAIE